MKQLEGTISVSQSHLNNLKANIIHAVSCWICCASWGVASIAMFVFIESPYELYMTPLGCPLQWSPPASSWAALLAPCLMRPMRIYESSTRSLLGVKCRGVDLCSSWAAVSAPCSTSIRASSKCPLRDAKCSGVKCVCVLSHQVSVLRPDTIPFARPRLFGTRSPSYLLPPPVFAFPRDREPARISELLPNSQAWTYHLRYTSQKLLRKGSKSILR